MFVHTRSEIPLGDFIFSQSKNSEIDWCLMNKLDIRLKEGREAED